MAKRTRPHPDQARPSAGQPLALVSNVVRPHTNERLLLEQAAHTVDLLGRTDGELTTAPLTSAGCTSGGLRRRGPVPPHAGPYEIDADVWYSVMSCVGGDGYAP